MRLCACVGRPHRLKCACALDPIADNGMDSMRKILSAVVLSLSMATDAWAHHAFAAEYDVNKVVTIAGTVTKFEWSNPHCWIYVRATDESGNVVDWGFEMGSPNGLLHRGWMKGALKEGDRITVDGYAAKDGRRVANARYVRMPNGQKLFGGFQSTPRGAAK